MQHYAGDRAFHDDSLCLLCGWFYLGISERQRLYARTAADQRNDIELCKGIKRHLISQMPLVIIYLESESDVSPICPQLEN